MLNALSPLDGRYQSRTKDLAGYFSEYALIKYRVFVEVQYLFALNDLKIEGFKSFSKKDIKSLEKILKNFGQEDAQIIKDIEKTTNHDVKAVEYYLRQKFDEHQIETSKEFIHFALTSQDINNTSFPLMLRDALSDVVNPKLEELLTTLMEKVVAFKDIPMLAKTHGQPASPTLLGKEFMVFQYRLQQQFDILKKIDHSCKFGGATGNYNAHVVTYPKQDWEKFGDNFCQKYLGLERETYTTQISNYDNLAEILQTLKRINTIFIDFCRDIWTYISMDYFGQKTKKNEVGSSAMPHKVNPIDFENAEGNLGMANAQLSFFIDKLPISRLQRDLTDSTVIRNIGVPLGHMMVAFSSLAKGLSKITLNEKSLNADLEGNWMVVAEGIQNILRKLNYPDPYNALKHATRGKKKISQEDIVTFIDSLEVSKSVKKELKEITPQNYTGVFTLKA